jgi:hypothetical protein
LVQSLHHRVNDNLLDHAAKQRNGHLDLTRRKKVRGLALGRESNGPGCVTRRSNDLDGKGAHAVVNRWARCLPHLGVANVQIFAHE